MRFRTEDKIRADKSVWHPWFAWFPVEIEDYNVWLETVLRKGTFDPDKKPYPGMVYTYAFRDDSYEEYDSF